MRKFEYKVVSTKQESPDLIAQEIAEQTASQQRDGWELVSSKYEKYATLASGERVFLIFKKEISEINV